MCIGDWRLSRLIRHNITAFTSDLTVPVVFPPNNQRVGVNIALTGSSISGVTFLQVTIGGVNVFQLASTIPFVHYDAENYGDLPQAGFSLLGLGVAHAGAVIEWFLPESVLAAGLQDFQGSYPKQ